MRLSRRPEANPLPPASGTTLSHGSFFVLRIVLLSSAALFCAALARGQNGVPMPLGGNLESLTDYSSSWVFKDCFKLARTWMTRTATGTEWESNQTPLTDADGWPLAVPFAAGGSPQILHTMLPLCGPGDYTLRFRGTGLVELLPPNGGGRQTIPATGGTTVRTMSFSPSPDDNILYLEVRESSGTDPVRDIEVIAPGQDGNVLAAPFHPEFLSSLAPYRTLRFMDWMHTNDSPLAAWTERTTANAYTQTLPAGVAHEYIVALANQTGKDPWICIPHAADDDYVRRTARLYRDTLGPGLVVYVEYSNETWNPQFMQTAYVQDRGESLGLDANRWQAGQKFVARRSAEIFAIFDQEYGTGQRSRFVSVLATQAANAGLSEERLAAIGDPAVNPSGQRPEALAIAPYFGVNYQPGMGVPTAAQVLTRLATDSIAEARGWTREQRAVAAANNLRLICYEGGQHFTGILGAENNARLTAVLHAANRDPRMESRYEEYLAAIRDEGVELFLHFAHIGRWSQWGSWGVLEHQQQPESEAPKWRAIKKWAARGGVPGPPVSGIKDQRVSFKLPPKMVHGGEYTLRATFSAGGAVGYSADPASAAQIDADRLRILQAGVPFTVTARQAGDAIWRAAEKQASGIAGRRPQRIAFTLKATRNAGEQFNLLATAASGLPVSVTSSAPGIVRINEDGTATALARGTAKLTATQPGDANHFPAKPIEKRVTVK